MDYIAQLAFAGITVSRKNPGVIHKSRLVDGIDKRVWHPHLSEESKEILRGGVTFKVNCWNKRHKIIISPIGTIQMCDHQDDAESREVLKGLQHLSLGTEFEGIEAIKCETVKEALEEFLNGSMVTNYHDKKLTWSTQYRGKKGVLRDAGITDAAAKKFVYTYLEARSTVRGLARDAREHAGLSSRCARDLNLRERERIEYEAHTRKTRAKGFQHWKKGIFDACHVRGGLVPNYSRYSTVNTEVGLRQWWACVGSRGMHHAWMYELDYNQLQGVGRVSRMIFDVPCGPMRAQQSKAFFPAGQAREAKMAVFVSHASTRQNEDGSYNCIVHLPSQISREKNLICSAKAFPRPYSVVQRPEIQNKTFFRRHFHPCSALERAMNKMAKKGTTRQGGWEIEVDPDDAFIRRTATQQELRES